MQNNINLGWAGSPFSLPLERSDWPFGVHPMAELAWPHYLNWLGSRLLGPFLYCCNCRAVGLPSIGPSYGALAGLPPPQPCFLFPLAWHRIVLLVGPSARLGSRPLPTPLSMGYKMISFFTYYCWKPFIPSPHYCPKTNDLAPINI
jgi:hypothetical protein